jgi:hypothetical protein
MKKILFFIFLVFFLPFVQAKMINGTYYVCGDYLTVEGIDYPKEKIVGSVKNLTSTLRGKESDFGFIVGELNERLEEQSAKLEEQNARLKKQNVERGFTFAFILLCVYLLVKLRKYKKWEERVGMMQLKKIEEREKEIRKKERGKNDS